MNIDSVNSMGDVTYGNQTHIKNINIEQSNKSCKQEDIKELQDKEQNEDGNQENRNKLIKKNIEEASDNIEIENKRLEFSIHKETNQIMIKVIDNNTQQLIREVPPEKILDIMAKMIEVSGNIIDKRG